MQLKTKPQNTVSMAIKRPNSRLSREVAPSQAHLYEKLGFVV